MVRGITEGEHVLEPATAPVGQAETESFTAVLLSQGKHRFYTLAMTSHLLAETCVVDPRTENPNDGFQRLLDRKRAQEIADYIDVGFGTIPGSIVLSAQPEAKLEYVRKARTVRFNRSPRAFLILDGQHRVYGFKLAKEPLRVPVVIYNNLTRAEEARLFMDINTKQRPVPPELILDIKRLAETETDTEALLRDVFDSFNSDGASPLFGLLSPAEKAPGKLSRVTFNQAVRAVWSSFGENDAESVYSVMGAYLHACINGLRQNAAAERITNPTLFKALLLIFPNVAQRVSDRFSADYNLNRLHIAQITSLLQASGKIPAFRIRASAYHCKNEGDAKLTSKSLRDGGGGAHEAFWDVFGMRLRQISEGVLLGPLDQASAQSVFAKLDSLQQSLRAKGAPLHSWLSVTRNELQYRHGYGVWLPGSLRRQDRERLSRVFGQWRRDPMDIDIGAVRDQPLDEFAVTCAFIVALCRTLLVRIGDRAEAGGRSFAKLGPLAVLRETERPLSDRQG